MAPLTPTGWAAPMFVPGAITLIGHASMMNVPADAARAPEGAVKQMTGTFEFRIAVVISRIEESGPPGVSIVSSTAVSPTAFAWPIPRLTYEAMNGSTTPFSLSDRTTGRGVAVWAVAPWATKSVPPHAREFRMKEPTLAWPIGR